MAKPKHTDVFAVVEMGVPKDIGWAIVTLHDDGTVTRVCKGCQATSRYTVNVTDGRVDGLGIVHHAADCPVFAALDGTPPLVS